jgi:hypothetical protein
MKTLTELLQMPVLPAWLGSPAPRRAALRRRLAPLPELFLDEEAPAGCGWFDSSHVLQTGLLVTEHCSADDVAAALPLDAWIDWHLRQCSLRRPGIIESQPPPPERTQ